MNPEKTEKTGRKIIVRAANGYVKPYVTSVLGVKLGFDPNRLVGKNPAGGPVIKNQNLVWKYFVGGK